MVEVPPNEDVMTLITVENLHDSASPWWRDIFIALEFLEFSFPFSSSLNQFSLKKSLIEQETRTFLYVSCIRRSFFVSGSFPLSYTISSSFQYLSYQKTLPVILLAPIYLSYQTLVDVPFLHFSFISKEVLCLIVRRRCSCLFYGSMSDY